MTPWPITQSSNVAAVQLIRTITIQKLYIYKDEYKISIRQFSMPQFICSSVNTFNTLRCDVLHAGVGYCSTVIGL